MKAFIEGWLCRNPWAGRGFLQSYSIVTGVVTDWKELRTPPLNIPWLRWVVCEVADWVTVDMQVSNFGAGLRISGFGANAWNTCFPAMAQEIMARL